MDKRAKKATMLKQRYFCFIHSTSHGIFFIHFLYMLIQVWNSNQQSAFIFLLIMNYCLYIYILFVHKTKSKCKHCLMCFECLFFVFSFLFFIFAPWRKLNFSHCVCVCVLLLMFRSHNICCEMISHSQHME